MALSRAITDGDTRVPAIVRDAPLLTFYLPTSPVELRPHIPSGLTPKHDARIILNMWFQEKAEEIAGFGEPQPIGVTYFAAEVTGEAGCTSDGATQIPPRFWLKHWNSSDGARRYAEKASALEISHGQTSLSFHRGLATATLTLHGRTVITAQARVGEDRLKTASGHSIYFAERKSSRDKQQLNRFVVPWVADSYGASAVAVNFDFPINDPLQGLVKNGPQTITSVSFRRITLVPYLATSFVKRAS
jgi:hypothetical protein